MYVQKNISDSTLIQKIQQSIRSNEPLSVTRLGDGEFHILKDVNDYLTQKEIDWHLYIINHILKRNGFTVNCSCKLPKNTGCLCYINVESCVNFLRDLRQIITHAIKNSTYIGLNPDGVNNNEFRIEKGILFNKYGINVNNLNVFNTRITKSKLIADISNFSKIINGKPIHIITPNVNRFKDIGFDKKIGCQISYTDLSVSRSYYQRSQVMSLIYHIKEDVILLGGGGALKDIPSKLSNELGKICLDLGSLLDAWSGNISRPIFVNEAKHAVWLPKKMCIGKYKNLL